MSKGSKERFSRKKYVENAGKAEIPEIPLNIMEEEDDRIFIDNGDIDPGTNDTLKKGKR